MSGPVSFEGVALANSALMTALLEVLLTKGVLSRDEVAGVIDQAQVWVEEVVAVSDRAAGAHTHLRMLEDRLLGPRGPRS